MRLSLFKLIPVAVLLIHLGFSTSCNNQSANAPNKTGSPATNQSPTEKPAPAPAPAPASTTATTGEEDRFIPSKPNPRLQTIKVFVGPHELKTELALTELQIRTGMMFRQSIEEDEAMLFAFAFPHQVGFWMKNVDIPLDGAYIDPDGVILEIVDMKPHDETPLTSKSTRVKYVLETKHGWFKRNGVGPGTLITTERGTLAETFPTR